MKRVIVFAARVIDRVISSKITLYSADATLFLLISAVPFVMLFMSTVQFILPFSQSELILIAKMFIPDALMPVISSFIGQLYTVPKISAVSVTALTALWAASKGFASLVKGLDNIYSRAESRGYFLQRIFAFIYTLIFIISIIITLLVIALGSRISGLISDLNGVVSIIASLRWIIFFMLLTALFITGYRVLPKRKVKLKKQIPGAVTASVSWIIFSYAFGIYIDNFSNYANIYGSLGVLILFVIWLYFCINIFMVGGVINVVLSEKNN